MVPTLHKQLGMTAMKESMKRLLDTIQTMSTMDNKPDQVLMNFDEVLELAAIVDLALSPARVDTALREAVVMQAVMVKELDHESARYRLAWKSARRRANRTLDELAVTGEALLVLLRGNAMTDRWPERPAGGWPPQ